jgi:glycosyltransferase involved in cell wall biosynthesis
MKRRLAMIRIDLIYFTYNRLDHTRVTLPTLLEKSGYPFKLTIVDNGSVDGTVDYLRDIRKRWRKETQIQLILNARNEGLAGPTNRFWMRSDAALVGKIDNDILVEEGWLEKLADAHQRLPNLAVIGGCHFPAELLKPEKISKNVQVHNTIQILRQPYIGGNYLAKRSILMDLGPLPEARHEEKFKLGGWTGYQQKMVQEGYWVGYYFPIIRFEHLHRASDTYFRQVRGLSKRKYRNWERKDAERLLTQKWNWEKNNW